MSDAPKMPTSRGQQALLATLGHTVMVTGNGRKKENTQNMSNTKQLRRVGEGVLPPESCTASGISRRDAPLGHQKDLVWRSDEMCLWKVENPVIAQKGREVKSSTKKPMSYSETA